DPKIGAMSDLFLSLENLTPTIHTALQIDMVRTAKFARVLVLDIGRGLECVSRTAHAALRRRRFSFRYSHGFSSTDRSIKVRHGPGGACHSGQNSGKSRAYTRYLCI